jgi:hypothetical protein
MDTNEVLAVLERFRAGYNEMNIPELEAVLSQDVKWGHRNRFKGEGRLALIQSMRDFSAKTPGRYFSDFGRFAIKGDTAFVEQTWHAVPAADDAAWGWKKGTPFSMQTCSVFVLDGDQIVDWSDYG